MKKILILSIVTILFFACSDIGESINKNVDSSEQKIEEVKEKMRVKKEVTEYYAWVDKLRVREIPSLDRKAKVVTTLDEGEKVSFLGEVSEELFEVTLRGRDMKGPFYKIKSRKGKVGWVFAGALSSVPVNVEHYRVAIFFDATGNVGEGGDFGYYASEAMNELLGTGIDAVFVNNDFDEVEIRNGRGEIIGVENISKKVKKHSIGVICVEKGRSQKYVDYSPDMGWDILDIFGLMSYDGC